ncbi:hypothetical protein B0O99DRAFT_722347 [Bisporella sp. PMI_857]|nr:hypothetical protein B0O99DRAFT_722347 [Bisporella sp. PMI_857]
MGYFTSIRVKKECDKSAQILKGFVKAIANAKGLAIFTAVRAGMYFAGSGGSSNIVVRLPDGTWSPPSAFSVRSGSIGLVYSVDVYGCLCVLNKQAAVEAYTKAEMNLGGAVALAAGPLSSATNMKEGLYGGLTIDSTVIKERSDANTDFYGSEVTTTQILKGEVQAQDRADKWPTGTKQLTDNKALFIGPTVYISYGN